MKVDRWGAGAVSRWVLLLAIVLGGCGAPPQFSTLAGSEGRWDDWHGRWVVLNYWAEWCGPCREEIPELNALDAARADVVVVGINFDAPPEPELRRQAEALAIEFPVLMGDPGGQLGLEQPSVLPMTFIIDPSGAVVHALRGPQTRAGLEALLR